MYIHRDEQVKGRNHHQQNAPSGFATSGAGGHNPASIRKLRESMRQRQMRNFNRKSCEMRKSVDRVETNLVADKVMKMAETPQVKAIDLDNRLTKGN